MATERIKSEITGTVWKILTGGGRCHRSGSRAHDFGVYENGDSGRERGCRADSDDLGRPG